MALERGHRGERRSGAHPGAASRARTRSGGVRLNAAQRVAVAHGQGPLLVLAGAGSGKTRVITHRIARLIEQDGVRPESILAVSFTNKAAAEMGHRMAALVGAEIADRLWLSTFHSFGVRFLNEEAKSLRRGGRFVVFDQGDSIGLVRDILRREGIGDRSLDVVAVQSRISLWKNRFVDPASAHADEGDSESPGQGDAIPDEYDAVAREVYPFYEAGLAAMRAFDFDDLVVQPARILRERKRVRESWRQRFRHLLIDEFQDTNHAQLELVRMLANDLGNVCVVGDDDQSIYGWRGADVGNILDFERHFPGTKVVKLEDNYRSHAPILAVANRVIAGSRQRRHPKTLRATRGPGEAVRLCPVEDPTAEAKLVAREIRDLEKAGHKPADVAVLYRSNLQGRLIEEELRAHGIPYRLFGGTQIFDRKEVKDAAAYLRSVVYSHDELSLRRILNYPPRGVGDTTVDRLEQLATARGIPFARTLALADGMADIPAQARRGLAALRQALEAARKRFRAGTGLALAARDLFTQVGIERDLVETQGGPSGARRWQNVCFLIGALERYERSEVADKPSLGAFLQRITMRFDEEEEESRNRVTLSTLHAAKGLEFDVVFLIGCVEGILPHSRTTDPKVTEAAPTDVEEERRLLYVGITRARERLYLTHARQRSFRGRTTPVTPSRFLDGLTDGLVEQYTRDDDAPMETAEVADMAAALLARLNGE